jgi:hypothetical protein
VDDDDEAESDAGRNAQTSGSYRYGPFVPKPSI